MNAERLESSPGPVFTEPPKSRKDSIGKRKDKKSDRKAGKLDVLTPSQRNELMVWIRANTMPKNAGNLVAPRIISYIAETFGIQVRFVCLFVCLFFVFLPSQLQTNKYYLAKLLYQMEVKYKVVAVGEYIMKARLPTTRNHRKLFIPFVAWLRKRADVVVLTHDESNMTVNLSQRKAYVCPGDDAVDERKKSGAGLGELLLVIFLPLSNRLLA